MPRHFIFNGDFTFADSICSTAETRKIELVGTFAASTTHEIRNPLTGIKGFVAFLKKNINKINSNF